MTFIEIQLLFESAKTIQILCGMEVETTLPCVMANDITLYRNVYTMKGLHLHDIQGTFHFKSQYFPR
jgi:hypothetical protein